MFDIEDLSNQDDENIRNGYDAINRQNESENTQENTPREEDAQENNDNNGEENNNQGGFFNWARNWFGGNNNQ
jgi:hypothetical protein